MKPRPTTHCLRGHELTGDNVYVRANGKRYCRACNNGTVRAASPSIWTEGELAMLRRLMEEGKKPDEIAAIMGISISRVKSRLYRENMTEEQRAAHAKRKLDWARKNSPVAELRECRTYINAAATVASRPSAELIAAAAVRAAAPPRDLTGAFLGDPPQGFSALDRRGA